MKYWADLTGIELDEADKTSWVHLLPIADVKHPVFGSIKITKDKVTRMATNVANKVRGVDLDIDYDHKAKDGKAAGWIKAAEARENGLWVQVAWTEPAYDALKKREYRYLSADYQDTWEHPESGVKHQDVLCGGALTNRPFMKNIIPINLSELEQEENQLDPKKLRKRLGLPEDATDEQVAAELDKEPTPPPTPKPEDKKEDDKKEETEKVPALLSDEERKQLSENNPLALKLLGIVEAQNTQLSELNQKVSTLETSSRGDMVARKLSEVTSGQTQFAVTPAAKTALSEAVASLPVELSDKVLEAVGTVIKQGIVELGERGGGSTRTAELAGAAKKFDEAVAKLMGENKGMTYADAAEAVAAMDADLYEEHSKTVFSGGDQ